MSTLKSIFRSAKTVQPSEGGIITIGNSYCVLKDFSFEASEVVRTTLTYDSQDVIQEIQSLKISIGRAMRFKKGGQIRWMKAKIAQLEQKIEVCWLKNNQFPTGHIHLVTKALDEAGSSYELADTRKADSKKVKYSWANTPLEPRYFQTDMLALGLKHHRGVFSSAVGSGKTYVTQLLVSHIGVVTLVVLPSKDLSIQTYDSFVSAFGESKVELITTASKPNKPIRICTVQTLAAALKKGTLQRILENVGMVCVDEVHHCLAGGSKLQTDQGIKTIKEVVEQKLNCRVLSFNKDSLKFEYKKVIDHFEFDGPDKLIRLSYEINGRPKILTCTPNHKVFTENRGYVVASELTLEDSVIIEETFVCNCCNRLWSTASSLSGHVTQKRKPAEQKISDAQKMRNSEKWNGPEARISNRKSKLGSKNPIHLPGVKERASIGIRAWWAGLSEGERFRRISIFQNAPIQGVRKGPTSLEQRIISLSIPGLTFTGNGSFWLTSAGKHLNPDFIVPGRRLVVEVGDIEYWHTIDDISERIELLKNIGYQCLYLTSADMKALDDEELAQTIRRFIDVEAA